MPRPSRGAGFHRGAVRELSDGGDEVDAALDGLAPSAASSSKTGLLRVRERDG